uniref:Calcium-activated chloride channel regulator 4, 30 kDa form n=1 Tax=Daphnia magna TaxID=35525 RepID=A0A0P5N6L4_9CRUS
MAVFRPLPLLLVLYGFFGFTFSSRVSITHNGYSDLVVAISPDVHPDQAADLLYNIQRIITEASADLYAATRQRSYIQSVQILIPQTWVNITANASTWETFQDAEIQIDHPNWKYGDMPYTVQLGGCGDPGQYIHWTPNYVNTFDYDTTKSQFGPAGKLFVREWARLRYGVFEEHGYTGADTTFPTFYRPGTAQQSTDMVPNVCSHEPVDFVVDYGCGVDRETGIYDSNCTYSFANSFKPTSSILSDNRMLSSAVHFCDDDPSSLHRHNREAPTKQNAVCNTQSVWSVISKHADFASNNNPPATIDNVKPTFNIIRVLTGARYVLVTDVSGSMDSYDRITRLNEAARRWIKYDIAEGTSLGIVKFSTSATMLSDLTVVNDNTRQQLMDKVPNHTEGGTCIGCGLQIALDILEPGGKGGVIVLVTDGLENEYPYIEDMYPQLIDAQVQVVSIAFGDDAEDEIEVLATKTNGKSYFINDDGNDDELNDAFTGSLTYQPAVPTGELTVLLFQEKYRNGNSFEDSVFVDFTIGRNLTFRVDYTNRYFIKNFSVNSPSGQVYDSVTYDNSAKLAYIIIPGLAEEGEWRFTLNVYQGYPQDYANVIVTSRSRNDSAAPITVECSVPSGTVVEDAAVTPVRIVAVVKHGRDRVLGANVVAHVVSPNSADNVVQLEDNGIGGDLTENNGIYSGFYLAVNNAGRYTLVCEVNSAEGTYIDDGITAQQRTAMGNFERVQSGGTFRVETPMTTMYPPSRVTDLKVVAMQVDQMSFKIEWTATGDQLDVGTASAYQIKYSTTFDSLMDDNFDSSSSVQFGSQDIIDGSMQPLESGSKQRVSLRLPPTAENATYYVALRAINNNNVASNTSNVVSVQIVRVKPPPTQPPPPPTTTTLVPPTTSSSLTVGCDGVLTTPNGLLTSPNYPGAYPNNYNCQWTIQVDRTSKIRLTFSHFDTESPFDYVEVYDGSSDSATRLLKHSGFTVPNAPVSSSSNKMLVRFVTDSTGNNFRGWRATYTIA